MTDRPRDDQVGASGPAGRGFDRIKPPERRLMERSEGPRFDSGDADPQGRAALYTAGPEPGDDGAILTVQCSRCEVESRLDPMGALRSAVPLFLVAPWKAHPVFAVCPACRRRSWLRPGLAE